jgi:long-chain acyl-CoA synthetase
MAQVERFIVKVEEGVPGSEGVPSKGPVYRSLFAKDGFPPLPEGLFTTWDLFSQTVKRGPNNRMLGVREVENGKAGKYVWQTYQKVYESVLHIGSAMRHLGVKPVCCCPIPKCGKCVLSLLSCGNCLKIQCLNNSR